MWENCIILEKKKTIIKICVKISELLNNKTNMNLPLKQILSPLTNIVPTYNGGVKILGQGVKIYLFILMNDLAGVGFKLVWVCFDLQF
jgi:hypothetical protein